MGETAKDYKLKDPFSDPSNYNKPIKEIEVSINFS